MKKIKIFVYFLKLIRWTNLMMVLATMILIRYCVIRPMLQLNDLDLQLPLFHFFLLAAATTLITAAGYIINDYFDRKTDLINRPYKVIIGRFIKRRSAMFWHTVFNILGVTAGIYISMANDLGHLSVIFIIATGILWFYSTSYKRQVFIGNLIVAILTALVPLLVIVFELPLLNVKYQELLRLNNSNFAYLAIWIFGFAYFAFITTLIREIIKDTEDLEGDRAFGRVSLPMAIGIKWTKTIVVSLNSILAISLIMALAFFINDPKRISLIYLALTVILPSFYLSYKIIKAKNKEDYSTASILMKTIMIFGVLYAIIVYLIVSTQL